MNAQTINYPRDRMILDVGFERWDGAPDSYNERWYSNMVALTIFKEWASKKNGLSIAIGGDVSWHHYHSDLYWDEKGQFNLREEGYTKNKISTIYLDVPVEFRFRARRDKNGKYFRFYIGGKVGYNLKSWNTYITDDVKYKLYHSPGIQDFRYGVHARIGWSYVSVFAQYMVSPLYEEGSPVDVHPFSFGISLMAF